MEPTPVVLIEGWAAGTSPRLFDGIDTLLNEGNTGSNRRLLVVKCGSYSSLWDRVIEIYYALKGGRCDYGQKHAEQHGHSRYGRTHATGLYPNWATDFPLHFIGHSFGGSTIWYLQQMLADPDNPFPEPTHPNMVKSLTSVSTPFRGTPLASIVGQLDTPLGGQKRFSIGWMMAITLHLFASAPWLAQEIYDFGADQWLVSHAAENPDDIEVDPNDTAGQDMSAKMKLFGGFYSLFQGKTPGFSSDSAGYCMLLSSMEKTNADTELCSETYYRSYTTECDPTTLVAPLSWITLAVANFEHAGSLDPEWQANDVLIPVKSQQHPKDCHQTTCLHLPFDADMRVEEPPPIPGVWHVKHYFDTTHFGLVSYLWKMPILSGRTKRFWIEFGDWLRRVDKVAEVKGREVIKEKQVEIVDA